jgi:hypothetical protein
MKIFVGRQITCQLLVSKGLKMKLYLTKDQMWTRGKNLFKEGKKALAFSLDNGIWDNTKKGLPSGKQDPPTCTQRECRLTLSQQP